LSETAARCPPRAQSKSSPRPSHPWRILRLNRLRRSSRAGLVVIRAVALGLGVGLGHVLALLGLAIPTIRRTVVHLGGGVDPHLIRSAAGSWRLARRGS